MSQVHQSERRTPTIHLSVFVPNGPSGSHTIYHSGSVPLTPERIELLSRLVDHNQWKLQLGQEKATWRQVEADILNRLEDSAT
jgi:hypothetical protein